MRFEQGYQINNLGKFSAGKLVAPFIEYLTVRLWLEAIAATINYHTVYVAKTLSTVFWCLTVYGAARREQVLVLRSPVGCRHIVHVRDHFLLFSSILSSSFIYIYDLKFIMYV
jgi:hypothetical protein